MQIYITNDNDLVIPGFRYRFYIYQIKLNHIFTAVLINHNSYETNINTLKYASKLINSLTFPPIVPAAELKIISFHREKHGYLIQS